MALTSESSIVKRAILCKTLQSRKPRRTFWIFDRLESRERDLPSGSDFEIPNEEKTACASQAISTNSCASRLRKGKWKILEANIPSGDNWNDKKFEKSGDQKLPEGVCPTNDGSPFAQSEA